jgi:hypothetical protein
MEEGEWWPGCPVLFKLLLGESTGQGLSLQLYLNSLLESQLGEVRHKELLHSRGLRDLDHVEGRQEILMVNITQPFLVDGVVIDAARHDLPDLIQTVDQGQARRVKAALVQDHAVAHVEEPVVDPLVVQVEVQREEALLQEAWLAEVAA